MEKVVEAAPFCDRATLVGSLLVRVMNTVLGAGTPRDTGKLAELNPGSAMTFAGRMIPFTTERLALAPETVEMTGVAVSVLDPVATPVTGTETVDVFAAKVTLDGTVAAAVLDDTRLTARPAGPAALFRLSVMLFVPPTLMVLVPAGKLKLPETVTVGLAGFATYPGANSVTFVAPKLTPVTTGWTAGIVAPAAMETEAGEIVAVVGSLVARLIVTAVAGAGDRVKANIEDWPGATVVFDGTLMLPGGVTFTVTEAGVTFGALLLAETVVLPTPNVVTGTIADVELGLNVTLAGTVAAVWLLDDRFTVRPLAGAGEDRFNVTFVVVPAEIEIGPVGKFKAAPTNTCLVPGA